MSWYYVLNSEQQGPVEQAQLEQLIQQGVITGETLVWREGMANWQPYNEVAAPPAVTAPPGQTPEFNANSGGVVCSECGQIFAADQVIRLGGVFVCARCKPIITQKLREGVPLDSQAEQIRKEHIKHEASVKSVGMLYFIGSGIFLLAAASLTAQGTRALLVASVLITVAVTAITVGIGLRRLKPWARIGSGIFSGIGLLGIPLGTIINGYILYLLFSKKGATVFSDEYKRVIQQTPHVKYRTSIIIWILLGCLVLLIGFAMVAFFFAPAHR